MPQEAAKNSPPGGRRLGKVDVEHRTDFVEQLLLKGCSRPQVLAACAAKFAMSPRTADDYLARVRAKWEERSREDERSDALKRYGEYIDLFLSKGAFNAIVGVERLRAQVAGLLKSGSHIEVTAQAQAHSQSIADTEMDIEQALHHLLGSPKTIRRAIEAGLIEQRPELRRSLEASGNALLAVAQALPSADTDS